MKLKINESYTYYAGYGSLVNPMWAKQSVPDLKDFAMCTLKGYRRVFGKVHPIWTPRCSNVSSKGLSYAIRRIWLKTLSRSQTHFGLPNVIYIKL